MAWAPDPEWLNKERMAACLPGGLFRQVVSEVEALQALVASQPFELLLKAPGGTAGHGQLPVRPGELPQATRRWRESTASTS